MIQQSRGLRIAAGVAVVFGVLSILSGGRALFGGVDMGAVVPFVLWFNFAAGFAYAAAGLGLWFGQRWAMWLACAIAALTALVLVAFALHAARGGAFEARTVGAMVLRTGTWVIIAAMALRAGRR
jgi:hypothetical protein